MLGEPVEVVVHDLVGDDRFNDAFAVLCGGERRERRRDLGVEPLLAELFERQRLERGVLDLVGVAAPSV